MDKKAWGKLLVILREDKGLNQKQMATKLDVTASALCKWEKGVNCPSMEELKRLAVKYDIVFEDFINPEETLHKLQQGIRLQTNKRQTASVKKGFLCVAMLLVLILGGLAAVHFAQPKFRVVATRYNEGGVYGTAYEMAIVCRKGTDKEKCEEYADSIYGDWKDGKLTVEAVTLDLHFYTSVEDALGWEMGEWLITVLLQN